MSDTVRVYPSLTLGETEYVRGVPAEGADLSREEAQPLLDAGLVRLTKPAADPAAPPVLVSDAEGNPVPLGTNEPTPPTPPLTPEQVRAEPGHEIANRPAAPAAKPKE